MTLKEWTESNKFTWVNVERQLNMTRNGSILTNRIKRLRSGKTTPTSAELKAVLKITKGEVCDYRD